MSVWFLSSSLDLNCLEIRVQACHCLLCSNKDGRASLKPGVSYLSANLLKSYLTIIFFQKEYLHICYKIFFLICTGRIKWFLQEVSIQSHAIRSGILFVPFVWCSCCRRSSLKESMLSNSWAFFRKSSTWSILTANCIKKTKDGRSTV